MILSKIKKHFLIALVRLNQKRELKKILNEEHIILNIIVKSFLQILLIDNCLSIPKTEYET